MAITETTPQVCLTADVTIPQIGFGLWQVPDDVAEVAVGEALAAGYRHFDTAKLYRNESGLGRALAASGIPRREVFVTTKVWNDDHRREDLLRAVDGSLERLRTDYVDLLLIHWPVPSADRYVEAWRTLLELRDAGRARAVGVSNFQPHHLQRLLAETGELPCLNQIELHPYLQQREAVAFHAQHGIRTQSWSPLSSGGPVLADPVVCRIAARHGVSPAQAVLRWHLDQGYVVLPKSVTPARIRENIDLFDFRLDDEEMSEFADLDQGTRTGPDPDVFAMDAAR